MILRDAHQKERIDDQRIADERGLKIVAHVLRRDPPCGGSDPKPLAHSVVEEESAARVLLRCFEGERGADDRAREDAARDEIRGSEPAPLRLPGERIDLLCARAFTEEAKAQRE